MKAKLLISSIALGALLCVAGTTLAIQNAIRANAEDANPDDVAALMTSYIQEGKYTKKTQIFFTEETKVDMESAFHARHNVLERTTYYDETTNALLMGDYDGGFEEINSGYRAVGDDMKHFSYTGTNESTADYFTAVKDDYTVKKTSPNDYFVNLTGLAKEANADGMHWTTDGTSFYYDFPAEIDIDAKGDYDCAFLKAIQYFAAPMLLQGTAYYTPAYAQIQECTDWLSIRIYTSTTDNSKLTVFNDANGLLAEARVFKGLQKEEATRWVIRGEMTNWEKGDPIPMAYFAGMGDPEQYHLSIKIDRWTEFKVVNDIDDVWYGPDALESDISTCFYHTNGNMETTATRQYELYWKGAAKKLWASSSLTLTINLCAAWVDAYPFTAFHYWIEGRRDFTTWPGQVEDTAASFTVTINGFASDIIVNGLVAKDQSSPSLQSVNINISNDVSSITVNSLALTDGKASDITIA